MFESSGHGGSLDEELFEAWLEKGRSGKVGFHYLIVIWNSWDNDFRPAYVETREDIYDYQKNIDATEEMVAIYDLYSESRVVLND